MDSQPAIVGQKTSKTSKTSTTTSSAETKTIASIDTPGYEKVRPLGERKGTPGYETFLPAGEQKQNVSISSTGPKGSDSCYSDRVGSKRELISARTEIKKSRISKKQLDSKADKKKLLLICIVFTVAMVLAGLFMYLIWHLQQDEEHEEKESLMEFCQNHITSKNAKDADCIYHQNPYPVSCAYAVCQIVKITISSKFVDNITGLVNFKPDKRNERVNTILHDFTPCAEGKWCIDGQCESTTDTRVTSYSKELKKIDGKFKADCYNEYKQKCFVEKKDLSVNVSQTIKDCTEAECYFYWNESDFSLDKVYRFAFVTCNNPFPFNGGADCWSDDTHYFPMIAVTCTYCHQEPPSFPVNCQPIKTHGCLLNCSNKMQKLDDGYPCKTMKYSGVCFLGHCIPFQEDLC